MNLTGDDVLGQREEATLCAVCLGELVGRVQSSGYQQVKGFLAGNEGQALDGSPFQGQGTGGEDSEQHEAKDQCQRLQTHQPEGPPVRHLLSMAALGRGCVEHDCGVPAQSPATDRGESGEVHV